MIIELQETLQMIWNSLLWRTQQKSCKEVSKVTKGLLYSYGWTF